MAVPHHSSPESTYSALLNAVAVPLVIVDENGYVHDLNERAAKGFNISKFRQATLRTGEVMNCPRRTDGPTGCGSGALCGGCVLRRVIRKTLQTCDVAREALWVQISNDNESVPLTITGSPIEFSGKTMVLLMFDGTAAEASEHKIIPVCAGCKKIRDEQQTWKNMEQYFSRLLGADFSHGMCPECRTKYYPSVANIDLVNLQ